MFAVVCGSVSRKTHSIHLRHCLPSAGIAANQTPSSVGPHESCVPATLNCNLIGASFEESAAGCVQTLSAGVSFRRAGGIAQSSSNGPG